METSKVNISIASGIITIACAIGMMAINFFGNKHIDSFITPFILLMVGLLFLGRKSSEKREQFSLSPVTRNVLIVTLSISLVSGIVMLLYTLL